MIQISAFWLGVTLWIVFNILGILLYKKFDDELAGLGFTILFVSNIFAVLVYFTTCNCVRLV